MRSLGLLGAPQRREPSLLNNSRVSPPSHSRSDEWGQTICVVDRQVQARSLHIHEGGLQVHVHLFKNMLSLTDRAHALRHCAHLQKGARQVSACGLMIHPSCNCLPCWPAASERCLLALEEVRDHVTQLTCRVGYIPLRALVTASKAESNLFTSARRPPAQCTRCCRWSAGCATSRSAQLAARGEDPSAVVVAVTAAVGTAVPRHAAAGIGISTPAAK